MNISNSGYQGAIAGIKAAITGDDAGASEADLAVARQEFIAKLDGISGTSASNPKIWSRWAAVSALATVVGLGCITYLRLPSVLESSKPVSKIYATALGQRASITLMDGSRVTLAPATTLKVTGRNIELDGEALFSVKQHSASPFSVKTNNTIVRVLGTTFGVRKYSDDRNTRIAVADGKVAVASISLTAGQVAVVNASGQAAIKNQDNVKDLLSWSAGRLVFNDVTLGEALPDLARWYNVDFILSDPSLANRRIGGELVGETLTPESLDLLAATLGVRYTRVGRTITLYPGSK